MKLLYFFDFTHFKQTGKSVTGQKYYAWAKGPVPTDVFFELSNGMREDMTKALQKLPSTDFQKVTPKIPFDKQFFTNRELGLLEQISYIFKEATADQMVEATHFINSPWNKTLREKGEKKLIDYKLALDTNRNALPYEEAIDRMNERIETYIAFGIAD